MPQILNFTARAFHPDDTIAENSACRVIITQLGKTIEQYELDASHGETAQIVCVPELQPNMEYIFRFVVTYGYNDAQDEISRCVLVFDGDWEDRYEYDLAQSRFQPMLSKGIADGGMLRLYEIPFMTTETADVQILFLSRRCVTKICPPFEYADYASLPDLTYAQWLAKGTEQPKPEPSAPEKKAEPTNPVDALVQKLDRLTAPGTANPAPQKAATSQDEEDEKLANFVQEYMMTRGVEMTVPDAMKTFSITERQATKCMRILFERNVLKYDLETRKYKIDEKKVAK